MRAGFTTGLNEIFLVGGVLALVGAVLTLVLIRGKDFEAGSARSEPASPEGIEPPSSIPGRESGSPPGLGQRPCP